MPRINVAYDQTIKALPPKSKVYLRMFDGIGVRVFPSGAKTFVFWFREGVGDKKRMLRLGEYPEMSLAEAQKALRAAQTMLDEGIDPAAAKIAARARKVQAARGEVIDLQSLTVQQAFDAWRENDLAPFVDSDGTRHGRKDGGLALLAQFRKHVFPTLGALPLRSLSKGDVLALLDRTKKAGTRRTASVLFSSLRQMLDWCEDREYIAANPTRALKKKRVVGSAVARTRVLDDEELKLFVDMLPRVDLHVVTVLALRFLLATGQRPGEVAGMPKAELDKSGKLWTIPASRYKTGEVHTVPLSPYARSILAEAAQFNSASEYVFPSPNDDERPIDRHSLSRALLRKHDAMGIAKAFTPHDLRRTCRTRLAALGVPDYIGEKVLGHKLEGMLATYNLHSYLDERRDALEQWGRSLSKASKKGHELPPPS